MNPTDKRRVLPVWILLVTFLMLYTVISVVLTVVFRLPWYMAIPRRLAIGVGLPLLLLGALLLIWSFRSLGSRRAFGKELFLPKSECQLITNGVYAYTRNPLYLSVFICFLGWSFVLRLTPVAFLTVLFLLHCLAVAKWEERELSERFGQEYDEYKKRVPFFISHQIHGRRL